MIRIRLKAIRELCFIFKTRSVILEILENRIMLFFLKYIFHVISRKPIFKLVVDSILHSTLKKKKKNQI